MLEAIEYGAVVASAIYGILRASRNDLDVVGMISVAYVVAFGGGTLRDLFLNRQPLFWIGHPQYPIVVFGLGVLGALIPRQINRVERYLAIPDAVGLGLFSVVGAGFAIQSGTSVFVASILGVVTGTFGGVIGDVICNEIPSLFRSSPLYATCSFAGAWVYLLCRQGMLPESIAVTAGIVVTVTLRMAALRWDVRIPAAPERDE